MICLGELSSSSLNTHITNFSVGVSTQSLTLDSLHTLWDTMERAHAALQRLGRLLSIASEENDGDRSASLEGFLLDIGRRDTRLLGLCSLVHGFLKRREVEETLSSAEL